MEADLMHEIITKLKFKIIGDGMLNTCCGVKAVIEYNDKKFILTIVGENYG